MVVLPESGWEMMARLRRRSISSMGATWDSLIMEDEDSSVVEESGRSVFLLDGGGLWIMLARGGDCNDDVGVRNADA